MPNEIPASLFKFPLSGDVTQAINPWTWWLRMMSQIGFININMTKSSDPQMERQIIENVAGYGKQLGRIIEALDAMIDHTNSTGWSAEQKKALQEFTEIAREVAAVKGNFIAPTKVNVDRFIEGIRQLKKEDEQEYGKLLERLKTELFPRSAKDDEL
jgi:acyl carrier protein phosphodiesterase